MSSLFSDHPLLAALFLLFLDMLPSHSALG